MFKLNSNKKYTRSSILMMVGAIMMLLSSCGGNEYNQIAKDEIQFNRDVRPILNNNCIGCHGGVKQTGGLSFILREDALKKVKSGKHAIIPGDSKNSELIARIKSKDPDFRMPYNEEPLSKKDIKTLEKWIDQGAKWEEHWAFMKPVKASLPEVNEEAWIQNPIDHFILERIESEGLDPAEIADKITLIRRVSLDIIGLPPSIEAVNTFIEDDTPEAYKKLVDRLLNSNRYGEKWAGMWMDLARYADSKGYEKDGPRIMWKYRDWLIDAFNNNMPYNEFSIEQLAGDMLPNATLDQKIATAFHRNTMNNDEGGTIDEEYRMAAVIDRVNTTWDVWQGTTFSCVQCHSHPYDPFDHKEYFEFLSFFNNTADVDHPSEKPTMEVFSKEQEQQRTLLNSKISLYENDSKFSNELKYTKAQLDSITGVLLPIMQELADDDARETHVHLKGNRLDLGVKVTSDVPDILPPLKSNGAVNRLEMAEWLFDQDNPLTSRVAVNRIWAQLFGRGIVETEEDFGSQGIPPTHPELLDWLAVEFQADLKWDIKALIKLIVTSATYMQDSKVSDEHLKKDPYNYLLARGARVRLSAESVRDQTLFVTGLLSDKMYGESVMPYQPDGVWQAVYSGQKWELSEGEDAYRRALYTYWRRTSPYPSMESFDMPTREVCVIRRIATNTPLQALVTLNDPVYIEAANALGELMEAGGNDVNSKIGRGFQLAFGRLPEQKELDLFNELYVEAEVHMSSLKENEMNTTEVSNDSVKKTLTANDKMTEIAFESSLSIVANAILNLNEFTTKQ